MFAYMYVYYICWTELEAHEAIAINSSVLC